LDFLEATGVNALIITILMLLVALRIGRLILWRLKVDESPDSLDTLFFSVGLGLGFISLAAFAAGAVGLLYRPVFQGAFVLALVLSLPGLARDFRSLPRKLAPGAWSWLSLPVLGLLAGITVICLLAALAPETGFDALNYHLGTPRLYIASHQIVETENLAGYSHPLAVDMLYVFAWLVHSSLAAKLVHFALGILTAAGCWVFCRRYAAPGSGPLAALLFLASPIVMFLSQSAYADLGLAFFALLTLFAVFRWVDSGIRNWIVLGGVYAGLSLGAKYMGAAVVAAAAVAILVARKPRRHALLDLALFCAVTLLVFAPWIIKNWIMTGNPVAPALADVIPTRGFSSPDYDRLVQLTRSWHGYSGSLLDWVLTPWRQTFRPDIFHGSPGFAYLVLFPVALILSWRDRWMRLMTLCVIAGYLSLLVGTATTRFFVLVFPWISILIAGALWRRPARRPAWSRVALVVSALVLVTIKLPWFAGLGGIPEPLILDTDKITIFRTAAEREQFLEAKALGPGGNELYEYLNELPKGTRILALTPVYQALTDHQVFMPPNSTPSSEMASAAIDLAKSMVGLKDIELGIDRPVTARFWKVQIDGFTPLTPDEARPRLFFIENGIPMEIAVYGVTAHPPEQGTQDVVVDLGAPSRVERVTLVSREWRRARDYRVFALPGGAESQWRQAQVDVTFHPPNGCCLLNLLQKNRITHVVLGHHAGAAFLPELYVNRRPFSELEPLRSFGNYEVLASADTFRRRVGFGARQR